MALDEAKIDRQSFGCLINNLSPEIKSKVRNLEKINRKIINCSYAVKFNETCIKEDLLPNYTDIYIQGVPKKTGTGLKTLPRAYL